MIAGKIETEKSLLGAILLKPSCIWDVIPIIKSADFFVSYRNKIIYQEIISMLNNDDGVIDLVILQDRLIHKKLLSKTGGLEYLEEILDSVGCLQHAEIYAKEVRDQYIRRRMCKFSADLVEKTTTGNVEEIMGFVDENMSDVTRILDGGGDTNNASLLKDVLLELNSDKSARLSSGYSMIDDIILGYDPGDLIILAARPSMGKTTMALNMMERLCRKDKRVLFFSLEMKSKDIIMNLLAHRAMINTYNLRRNHLNDSDYEKIMHASNEIAKYPLIINDFRGHTVQTMRAKAKTLHAMDPIDLIVIDHMSKIQTPGRSESETLRISKISNQLCQLAGELNVPILCLHQLNRGIESRDNKKPRLSDLRQSGEIEQDADIVMFIYRQFYYENNPALENQSMIIVSKNRKGRTGEVSLECDLKTATFYDHAPLGPKRV